MSRRHTRLLSRTRLAREAVLHELTEIRRQATGRLCHFGFYTGYQVVITTDDCERIDRALKAAK